MITHLNEPKSGFYTGYRVLLFCFNKWLVLSVHCLASHGSRRTELRQHTIIAVFWKKVAL
jgi:hypothetical protein